MRGDILDALAIDIDLATIAQALEIFRASERPSLGPDCVFGFHAAVSSRFRAGRSRRCALAYRRPRMQAMHDGVERLPRRQNAIAKVPLNPAGHASASAEYGSLFP